MSTHPRWFRSQRDRSLWRTALLLHVLPEHDARWAPHTAVEVACGLSNDAGRETQVAAEAVTVRGRASARSSWLPDPSLLLLALLPLGYFIEGGGTDGALTQFLYGIGWVVVMAIAVRRGIRVGLPDLLWVAWFMVMLAAPIWNQGVDHLILQAFRFGAVGVGTILLCRAAAPSPGQMQQVLTVLMFGGALVGAFVLADYIAAGSPAGRYGYRAVHPVPLSMLGATTTLLGFLHYAFRRVGTPVFLAVGGIGVALMIISASKGPLVALLVAITLTLPLTLRRVNLIRAAGVLVVLVGALQFRQAETLTQRIASAATDPSTAARLTSFEKAYLAWDESPLFGSGLEGAYPHNLFLEVLANHGLVLGVVCTVAVATAALGYIRSVRAQRGAPEFVVVASWALLLLSLATLMVSWTYLDHKWLYISVGFALNLHLLERANRGVRVVTMRL